MTQIFGTKRKGIMTIENMSVFYNYGYKNICGRISLNEEIEHHLKNDVSFTIVPHVLNDVIVSLTLLVVPMFPGDIGKEETISIETAQATIDRLHAAYRRPNGSWAQRWIPFYCTHKEVRCVHGDEIIARRGRRRVCRICGRSLKGALPKKCFFTEELH
jgi:hypothetical protein